MNDDVLLPYKYSRIAHISSLFILKLAVKLILLNEKYLGIMFISVTYSLIFIGLTLKKKGIIRILICLW